MLRSRFESLPGAFNAGLIPSEKSEKTKKRGLKATFSRKFTEVIINNELLTYLLPSISIILFTKMPFLES